MRSASSLALVASLSLFACGGSDPAPVAPTPQASTAPAPIATAAPTPSSAPTQAPAAPAHPTPAASLLVLSKGDETLSIVDPTSLAVLARAPVGHDPHEVIASADGHLAYVSNYGGGTLHTLAVIDLVTQTAQPSIDLGALRGPHGLTFVGEKLWFTAEGAKIVGAFDPATSQVDTVIGTGQDRTHMLIVAEDQKRILTTNVASGTLSILLKTEGHGGPPGAGPGGPGGPGPKEPPPGAPPGGPGPSGPEGGPPPFGGPHADWEQTLIAVGAGTEGFDLSPNGAEVWAADAQDGSIAIVDPAKKKLVHRIDAKIKGANRLKFTPDGNFVLVSSLRGGDLSVYDVKTRKESKRIPIGHGAAGILVQPDGARAYVACTPDSYVQVIDLKSMTVVGKIDAGKSPDGLAWAVQH